MVAVLALGAGSTPPLRGAASEDAFPSKALGGTVPFAVYLPAGYDSSTTRYPVIYFLHGLPAAPYSYRGVTFVEQALDRLGRDAIVVAPQGARDTDSDPEYLDWGPGRNWETAISTELPAYVDAHYRTIAKRSARALVGVSAGGYGAVLLAFHHLTSFSVVESWSGYFHPTDPSGLHALDVDPRESIHTVIADLRREFKADPTYFAFYVGANDARFRAENVPLARELTAAKVPFTFRIYPGAHEQSIWAAHAPQWLTLALDRLASPGGPG